VSYVERHELTALANRSIQFRKRQPRARFNGSVAFIVIENGVQMPRRNSQLQPRRRRSDADLRVPTCNNERPFFAPAQRHQFARGSFIARRSNNLRRYFVDEIGGL
jgi:hypothetical protein